MNAADKVTLFSEVARVLGPGYRFGVYAVMRTGEGELRHPLPSAATLLTNAAADPEQYHMQYGCRLYTIGVRHDSLRNHWTRH